MDEDIQDQFYPASVLSVMRMMIHKGCGLDIPQARVDARADELELAVELAMELVLVLAMAMAWQADLERPAENEWE